MPTSASTDPRIRLFGQFVKRALDEARERGMSIDDIEAKSGLSRSTIYRWRRSEIESPQRKQVQAFCAALDIPAGTAGQILGWRDAEEADEPEPTTDPDVRAVLRRLSSPSVSDAEKTTIRATLRYLARGKG